VRRVRLALVAMLAVSGCASHAAQMRAEIAPHLLFSVPAPGELGFAVEAEQRVTAQYGDDRQVFEAHLSVARNRLLLIAFDPFGRRLFTLSEDGTLQFAAQPDLPAALRPENVLADIALVYWPEPAIARGLPTGVRITEHDNHRSISVGGREIIDVDYDRSSDRAWPRVAHYRNLALGYALEIESSVSSR